MELCRRHALAVFGVVLFNMSPVFVGKRDLYFGKKKKKVPNEPASRGASQSTRQLSPTYLVLTPHPPYPKIPQHVAAKNSGQVPRPPALQFVATPRVKYLSFYSVRPRLRAGVLSIIGPPGEFYCP